MEPPSISESMRRAIESASFIRQMFEEGIRLRAIHGDENVFDLSLGNPSAEPPPAFHAALREVLDNPETGRHRYMPNSGFREVRERVARWVGRAHDVTLESRDVFMTCGAAGGLNTLLKSVLDPGDEVILLAPYFPEYVFYVENHGGRVVTVQTDGNFHPDTQAIADAMTERTRIVLINSPNNPTGVVYRPEQIEALGSVVDDHVNRAGRPCYLVSDEPYRRIVYGDTPHGSVLGGCRHGVVASSFSKDLGLAGERIGFLALGHDIPGGDELREAIPVATRILGFVNAPALMQRVVSTCLDASVDLTDYRRNRDTLHQAMTAAGYRMPHPDGAFFLFPAAPGGDDLAFVTYLREHNVLVVPGTGFGRSGHFRISYAVPERVIEHALPLLRDAFAEFSPR